MAGVGYHSEEYRIFVGGLAPDIDKEEFRAIFDHYGKTFNYCYRLSRGYALISYQHELHAIFALASSHDTLIDGYQMQTQWANGWPRNKSRRKSYEQVFNEVGDYHTVYCRFDVDVTEATLEGIFLPFGNIEEIQKHDYLDCAFIRFVEKKDAARAICIVDGTKIDGWPVICEWSHREERQNHQIVQAYRPPFPNLHASTSTPSHSAVSDSTSGHSDISSFRSCNSAFNIALSRWRNALSELSINSSRYDSQNSTASTSHSSSISDTIANICNPKVKTTLPEPENPRTVVSEMKDKNQALLCKICMDKELGILYQPCGHLVSCIACAQKIMVCPLCRKTITHKIKAYLS